MKPNASAPPPSAETVRARLRAEAAPKPPLAVVVPFYDHPELLPPLAESLLEHTPPDVLLLFVENGSRDPAVRPALLRLAAENPGRVRVECLDENAGFAGACNHGLRAVAPRDAILLNNDTVVGPRWTDSLRLAAYAEERVGTVTAVSDNAWFASVPEEGPNPMPPGLTVAETARGWLHAPETAFDLHVGVGFCLYLRRDMLDDVGLLDEERFGKGYGEETDLCLRAGEKGWKHRITTRAFVRHLNGTTFDADLRNERLRESCRDIGTIHPGYEALKKRVLPLWAARRPALRLVDRAIRAFDAPKPLPRVLALSPGSAPAGFEPVPPDADAAAWAALGLSRDDETVSRVLECGAEAVAADEDALPRGSPLAERLAALHVAVLRPPFPAPPPPPARTGPKVSVVVPAYNVAKRLPRCLDALLAQTLRDIQVVCVDDASTDGTAAILRRYAAKDPRVVALFSPENHGADWSRSIAMERVTGEYLMFCDADDAYDPRMCAVMAGAMDRLGVDLAICGARHEGAFTEREIRNRTRRDVPRAPIGIRGRDDVLWNKIFRRDLVERSGIRFPRDPGIRGFFDSVFCFCYDLVGATAATLSDRLYVYTRRKGSLIDLRRRRRLRGSLDVPKSVPIVLDFAERNRLPPEKRQLVLPWCDDVVAEWWTLYGGEDRGEVFRFLAGVLEPVRGALGPATPWLAAIARRDEAALEALRAERARREAPAAAPPRPGPARAAAAAFARRLPVVGPHLRAVDACLAELRRLRAERRSLAGSNALFRSRTLRAEETLRAVLLEDAESAGPGTTGRGPDVPGAVVVTFTSYPARLRLAAAAAASLLRQDAKPDAVVLWLEADGFPLREAGLPGEFAALRARGLDVRWCRSGLRAYTKLVPSLETWPSATVVTADDDVFYPRGWLRTLLDARREHPADILAHRIRRIRLDRSGVPLPYARWPIDDVRGGNPSPLNLLTGCGGVLYPPGSLHPDAADETLFRRISPANDDFWFWAMAVRRGTPIRFVGKEDIRSLDTADETGPGSLNRDNNAGGGNDRQFRALLAEYPRLLDGIPFPTP